MGDSTRPSEAGERALRLLLTLEPSGAQPHINGSAAKVLVRDGWLTGVKGSYSLTVKARNFLAGVVDLVTTETRGVPAPDGYGYVTEYRGTCQHGNVSAWYRSNGEAMDAARDHGDIDEQPYREAAAVPAPVDGYTADHDTRMLLATRALGIGYTGEGAGGLMERAYYVGSQPRPYGDECAVHPAMRRYSNGECEACEVERQWLELHPAPMVSGAVRLWQRDATAADTYALANLVRVMDGVRDQVTPYPGRATELVMHDSGMSYGMELMIRTLVAVVIGGHHGADAEIEVIDYIRSRTASKVAAP